MRQEVQDHIDDSLMKIQALFEKAAEKIEDKYKDVKLGERIVPGTALANTLAEDSTSTGATLYAVIKEFLLEGYPGTHMKAGAKGGIYKGEKGVTYTDKQSTE